MENLDNAVNMAEDQLKAEIAAQMAARKAKAIGFGLTAGKAIGLMGLGALLTIGAQKFRSRNDSTVEAA